MDKIEVTQADRTLYHQLLSLGSVNLNRRRMGLPIVDGFELIAAHRLATRTDATPVATDVAALVEAAKDALPFMTQLRAGICLKKGAIKFRGPGAGVAIEDVLELRPCPGGGGRIERGSLEGVAREIVESPVAVQFVGAVEGPFFHR